MQIEQKGTAARNGLAGSIPRVLVVDADPDRQRRKGRIDNLKRPNIRILPARAMDLAQGRCTAGAFDLVIVFAGSDHAACEAFCESVRHNGFTHPILVVGSQNSVRDGKAQIVEEDPQRVRQAVTAILGLAATSEFDTELPAAAA